MDTTKNITHLSLCAGYDGIGIGIRKVLPTCSTIAYVEIEAYAIANLVAKMEAGQMASAPIYTDVKTFPYKEFCGSVDILSAGFPCQPFSQAGVKKGVEDPRHLYPYISRGVSECKPKLVFFENVEGIISSKTAEGESVLHYVLKDLERLGYKATAGIFSAEEVGLPHQRKRVFIMGYSEHNGYATCTESREVSRSQEEGGMQELEGRSGELSNTEDIRRRGRADRNDNRRWDIQKQEAQKQSKIWGKVEGCSGDVPNTNGIGGEVPITGEQSAKQMLRSIGKKGETKSVARPNEYQHEWEEPRVKPRLGGTTNEYRSRVDRLRLLGNGVVPETASKAFLVLLNRIINGDNNEI